MALSKIGDVCGWLRLDRLLPSEELSWRLLVARGIIPGVVGVAVAWYAWRRYDERGLPPGPRERRFWTSLFVTSTFHDLAKEAAELGDVTCIKDVYVKMILLNSLSVIKETFVDGGEDYSFSPDNMLLDAALQLPKGIQLTCPGMKEVYTRNRTRSVTCVRKSTLMMEAAMLEELEGLFTHLQPSVNNGSPVDMKPYLVKTVCSAFHKVLFSKIFDYDDPELEAALLRVKDSMAGLTLSFYGEIGLPAWLSKIMFVGATRAKLQPLVDYITDEWKNHLLTYDAAHHRDLMDEFISMRNADDDDDQRCILSLSFFMPDGVQTACGALSWILLYVAHHKQVQARIVAEIESLTGGNRAVKLADRPSLGFVEATIMEVTRLQTIFPVQGPHMLNKDVYYKGYRFPKGYSVFANLAAIHSCPTNYPEPEKFKPERFLDSEGKLVPSPALLPFGTGRKKCVGEPLMKAEWFIFLANFTQKYELSFPDDAQVSLEPRLGKDEFQALPAPYQLILKERH